MLQPEIVAIFSIVSPTLIIDVPRGTLQMKGIPIFHPLNYLSNRNPAVFLSQNCDLMELLLSNLG